jgi:MFS family permease
MIQPTASQRRRSYTAIYAGTLAAGIGIGMMIPLVALTLERDGVATTLIGLISAAPALAVLVLGPLVPWLAGRLGTLNAIVGSLLVGVLATLAMPLVPESGPGWCCASCTARRWCCRGS